MIATVAAELLIMRRRPSTWILLGLWTALALVFAYVVPYVTYLNDPAGQPLADVLPQRLVGTLLAGFPFFGGVFALMLGVLTFGSEYGWGTLKTLFTQRPRRLEALAAKLAGVAVALVPFTAVVFGVGALASGAVALREGAAVDWPSAWLVVRGLAAGWLILAVWAALGALLAVLSRGTALAIGVGILWALVIEGLLSALAREVGVLDRVVELFLRANAYSLVAALGVGRDQFSDNGPGSFSGPFVGGGQALLALGLYGVAFVALTAWILRRRDVT